MTNLPVKHGSLVGFFVSMLLLLLSSLMMMATVNTTRTAGSSLLSSTTDSNGRRLLETSYLQRIKRLVRIKRGNHSSSRDVKINNKNMIEGMGDDTKYDFVTQSIEQLGWKNPDAAIGNPLKGFMSYPEFSGYVPHIAESIVDISLEAYYIGLDELMIGNNMFDWNPLERRLNDAATRNRHVVLTVTCHYPNWHKLSVPQYILDDGLELFYYPDFLGGGYSPNYGDTRLLSALEQFIMAFGREYDGDPRIGFINLGLLGFWGEWHTFPHDYVPEHAKQSVITWYQMAFRTTKILARYPHKMAYDAGFGLMDGSFTYETIDGEANGNEIRPHYFWPSVVAAQQTDFWKQAPMGGETRPEQQPMVFEPWYPKRTYQKQDFLECVSTTHATFMAHHDMFINDGYMDEKLENALHAHARMGYNFMITQVGVIFPDTFTTEASVQIDVKIDQVGVAPFYYPLSLFLDCPDMNTPMEISGIESLINEGDSKVLTFRNIPYTPKCMKAVRFHLNSTQYGYIKRPIKFAQGQHGVVQVRIPLPSSIIDASDVEKEPYIVYNLLDVHSNTGKSVTELNSGTTIDLARVGRAVTIQADFYSSNMELQNENVTVEFRFNGKVHHERLYPFLLAGHRGNIYTRSLYLSTTGIKTIQTMVFDKRDKSTLLDHTLVFTIIDTTNEIDAMSQVPIPAPMMTRSMRDVFSKFLHVVNTPTITPVQAVIAPTMNYVDENAMEVHGFNTPSTPPLLILEDRRRRIEIQYRVTIAIASAVVLILAFLSCLLLHRRYKFRRVHDMNHQSRRAVTGNAYKNPI